MFGDELPASECLGGEEGVIVVLEGGEAVEVVLVFVVYLGGE